MITFPFLSTNPHKSISFLLFPTIMELPYIPSTMSYDSLGLTTTLYAFFAVAAEVCTAPQVSFLLTWLKPIKPPQLFSFFLLNFLSFEISLFFVSFYLSNSITSLENVQYCICINQTCSLPVFIHRHIYGIFFKYFFTFQIG